MFPIAGQMAGPKGLKFFVDTHGFSNVNFSIVCDTHVWSGGDIGLKKFELLFFNFFEKDFSTFFFKYFFVVFPWAKPGPSASIV